MGGICKMPRWLLQNSGGQHCMRGNIGAGLVGDHGRTGDTVSPNTESTSVAPSAFNRETARQHCLILARGDSGERFVFQAFPDRKEDKGNLSLTATRFGTFDEVADWLEEMNTSKAGVFVTVNRTGGSSRAAGDIIAVRACFYDHDEKDGPMRAEPPLPCSLLISSGHGTHGYFLLDQPADPAVFTRLQAAIAAKLGTDSAVTDLPRVMRLAGSINWKAEPVAVKLVEAHPERVYPIAAIARAFGVNLAVQPGRQRGPVASNLEPTADHVMIRKRCSWFDGQFTHPESVREPVWFAALCLVARCVGANDLAHEMSSGHPGYTHAETEERLARASAYPPPSCGSVSEKLGHAACATCRHRLTSGGPLNHGLAGDGAEPADEDVASNAAAVAEAAAVALENARPEEFLRQATFAALAELGSDDRDRLLLRIRAAIRERRSKGVTQKDVNQRLEGALRARARRERSRNQSGLPSIQVNDAQLRDVTDATMAALASANDREPKDFVRCGRLVRIVVSEEDGLPSADEYKVPSFKGRLSRVADFTVDAGNRGILECAPSNELVEEILSRADYPELPYLAGVTTAPIPRADGSFHTATGYDAETGMYLAPVGNPVTFTIPERPTPEDVTHAVQALRYPFQNFPLVGKAGFAHVLALDLTMLLRPLFKECVPAFLVRATSVGTGKSLLVEGCGITVYGCEHFSTFPPADTEAEMRKRITSALLESRTVIAIDNVEGRLSSESLATLITTGTWADRKLGGNSNVRIRNRVTVTVTGNNLQVDDDLLRRIILIDLCHEGEHPEARTDFVIPHLKGWLREHRDDLLGALMVLVRNWYALGKPKPTKVRPFGSFEEWTEVIGGIIEAAGVTGFRDDVEQMASLNDGLKAQWGPFLRAVHHVTWGMPFTVAQIAEMCPDGRAERSGHPLLADTLPTSIAARSDRGHGTLNHALGQTFKKIVGMHCDAHVLERAGVDPRSNVGLWRVRSLKPDTIAEPSRSGILFLDLLLRAGWWSEERKHSRISDSRTLCKHTVGHLYAALSPFQTLPAIPSADGPDRVEALRAWTKHAATVLDATAPTHAVVTGQAEAMLACILGGPHG